MGIYYTGLEVRSSPVYGCPAALDNVTVATSVECAGGERVVERGPPTPTPDPLPHQHQPPEYVTIVSSPNIRKKLVLISHLAPPHLAHSFSLYPGFPLSHSLLLPSPFYFT